MHKKKFRILIAEDDQNLGILLSDYLQNQDFEVILRKDGESALKSFNEHAYDLCLLDVMMPIMDGFSLAKEIRMRDKKTPIIFITAKGLKEDKLKAYGLGADYYITKPFDEEELLWKIKALLRRMPAGGSGISMEMISIGKFIFDTNKQSLSISGKTKRITEKESMILNYLFTNRNRRIKREELLKDLWGDNDYFLGRSLDVFITKLRKYLREDPDLNIENIFGVGFIFNVPEKD